MKKVFFFFVFNFFSLFALESKLVQIVNQTNDAISLEIPFLNNSQERRIESIYISPNSSVVYALQAPGYVYFASDTAVSLGVMPESGGKYIVSAPTFNTRKLNLKISQIKQNNLKDYSEI